MLIIISVISIIKVIKYSDYLILKTIYFKIFGFSLFITCCVYKINERMDFDLPSCVDITREFSFLCILASYCFLSKLKGAESKNQETKRAAGKLARKNQKTQKLPV
jgi:hypothetical protein